MEAPSDELLKYNLSQLQETNGPLSLFFGQGFEPINPQNGILYFVTPGRINWWNQTFAWKSYRNVSNAIKQSMSDVVMLMKKVISIYTYLVLNVRSVVAPLSRTTHPDLSHTTVKFTPKCDRLLFVLDPQVWPVLRPRITRSTIVQREFCIRRKMEEGELWRIKENCKIHYCNNCKSNCCKKISIKGKLYYLYSGLLSCNFSVLL